MNETARWNICLVSDFFYPNMGGVETHLYCLSQCLIERGHKVIIITHDYDDRCGVRYLPNGLKVYYIPSAVVYSQSTFPTLFSMFPSLRSIWIREDIDLVHGHQAFSNLSYEAVVHAKTMGLRTCFTDHSLFGFADVSSIFMNKVLKAFMSEIDHVICVSNTSKENTVLRGALNPYHVSVIPNAVIGDLLQPNFYLRTPNKVTIVVLSRLVYRKGIDLMVHIIPRICQTFSYVQFVIAGDGNKKIDLEQMVERHLLHGRVTLLPACKHHEIPSILNRGDIFLNTSLTEAFCMAILEAACCGLLVVSTKVGGIPEVLPSEMILLALPEEDSVYNVLSRAVELVHLKQVDTTHFHETIKEYYSWRDVAKRTEKVYEKCFLQKPLPFIERLRRYYGSGIWFGKIVCIIITIDFFLLKLLEFIWPTSQIDKVLPLPNQKQNAL